MKTVATLSGVALAVLCALGTIALHSGTTATAGGTCDVVDASNDGEELAFLGTINQYRAQHGLSQLALNDALNRAAEWMARDMVAHNTFGHTDSLGRGPFVRTVDCGYPIAGGENLAAGGNRSGAAGAFDLFRNSASHNANMLAPEYRQIGIARVYGEGTRYGWYWATTFGSAGAAVAPTAAQAQQPAADSAGPPAPGPEPVPAGVQLDPGAQLVTWTGPDSSPADMIAGHASNIVAVWSVDGTTGDWLFYVPGVPPFLNSLRTVSTGMAIWVMADAPVELPVAPG